MLHADEAEVRKRALEKTGSVESTGNVCCCTGGCVLGNLRLLQRKFYTNCSVVVFKFLHFYVFLLISHFHLIGASDNLRFGRLPQ